MATANQNLIELLRQGWRGDTATDLMKQAADALEEAAQAQVPEHLTVDGKTHYLVRGRGMAHGKWWVSTRRGDVPYSGMPLDMFLKYNSPDDTNPEAGEFSADLKRILKDLSNE